MTPESGGWRQTTLGALGNYYNGRGFKKSEWGRSGRPIIRIQNLTGSSGEFNYYDGHVDERNIVRQGDLLVSWAATLGAYVWAGPEALVNQHIFKVESKIDRRFHKYLLDHKLSELQKHTHGSGMVHITRPQFDSLPVSVPELHEQRRIVDLLESHFSHLDAAERYLLAARSRAESHEALARRDIFALIAERTALVPLLSLCSIANGQTPKGIADHLSTSPQPGSVPYYKVGDMNTGGGKWMGAARNYLTLDAANEAGLAVRPSGTVLIPKRGGAIATNKKRMLRTRAAIDLNTMGLISSPPLLPEYLWQWLRSIDLGKIADGSNVPQINAAQIRKLRLPVPDNSVQAEACARLDELDMSNRRLAGSCADLFTSSTRLRSRLLLTAFSEGLGGPSSD